MENFIIVLVLAVCIGLAVGYVVRAKKKGKACIGCPGCCQNGNCCPGCGNTQKPE